MIIEAASSAAIMATWVFHEQMMVVTLVEST